MRRRNPRELRISIHAPAQGATSGGRPREGARGFQFTLPHRERPPSPCPLTCHYVYFNSRSRTGSDCNVDNGNFSRMISIHAPAQGATGRGSTGRGRQSNFNSRSRTGSDLDSVGRGCELANFNSRSRTGSDDSLVDAHGNVKISIHAPAQGATYAVFPYSDKGAVFQFTLPHRERHSHGTTCI